MAVRREHTKHIAFLAVNMLATAVLYVSLINSFYSPVTAQKPAVLSATTVQPAKYPNTLLGQTANDINKYREKNGLNKVRQSPALDKIAQIRATDMQKIDYYAHKGSDGKYFSDIMKEQGITYTYACENLNISEAPTARSYINSWLGSPAHKKCLLASTHISAGYAIATIKSIDEVPMNEKVIVAIYADTAN